MRKRARWRRRMWQRWIAPSLALLAVAGLLSGGFWAWAHARGADGLWNTAERHPRIRTATPTRPAIGQPPTRQGVQAVEGPDSSTVEQAQPESYILQPGTPRYLPAFAYAELGCQWFGFGGQVFDAEGEGLDGLVVYLSGSLAGSPVHLVGITTRQNLFGPGGYEIFLADHLPYLASDFRIQLFTARGQPLSPPYPIEPPTGCEQNLALANFQAGEGRYPIMLPLVQRDP